MSKFIPTAILAGVILLDAVLCGFASGAVIISTGVAFYQGWSGITLARARATPAAVAGLPTYIPFPTYTLLPSYTPLPTYTALPTFTPAAAAFQLFAATPSPNADIGVTPAAPLQPSPTSTLAGQTVTYTVQAGDTLETIARAFGIPATTIIQVNALSPEDPQIAVGDVLTIPLPASTVLTATAPPTATPGGATSPAGVTPTASQPATGGATATPSPTANPYPNSSATPYPSFSATPYP